MKRRSLMQAAAFAATLASPAAVFAAPEAGKASRRVAVIFHSRTGHTRSVAEAIRAMTGADLREIKLVEPYPDDYRRTVDIVKEELSRSYFRPVLPLKVDFSRYDAVVIGSPTWWHHVAGPVRSWIAGAGLQGKLVLTFNDHGGGGEMECRRDFEALLKGNRLGSHLAIFGQVSRNDGDVRRWLQENGLA